jgi:type IV secretory pathway VirB2 component (pilin)
MPHIMSLLSHVSSSASLADPAGSSVLVAAVQWLQQTLLGTLATTVAIIAVASVGLMMLAGRVNLRYGLTVIVGSFILFGASTIVAGIQSSLAGGDSGAVPYAEPIAAATPPPTLPAPPVNRDPYAGASVPMR